MTSNVLEERLLTTHFTYLVEPEPFAKHVLLLKPYPVQMYTHISR